MTEYTPTTQLVENAYARDVRNAFIASEGRAREEFRRWLAEHDEALEAKARAEITEDQVRQAKADAWDEAMRAVQAYFATPDEERGVIVNPYGEHPADRLMREAREPGR